MNKKARIVSVIIVIGALFTVLALRSRTPEQSLPTTTPQPPVGTVKIGAVLPMTGSLASHGDQMKKGIQFALETSSAVVQVIYEDNMSTSKDTATAVTKLISVNAVPLILGPASSSAWRSCVAAPARHLPKE